MYRFQRYDGPVPAFCPEEHYTFSRAVAMVMARLVLPGVVVCVTNVATIQESMQLLIYVFQSPVSFDLHDPSFQLTDGEG